MGRKSEQAFLKEDTVSTKKMLDISCQGNEIKPQLDTSLYHQNALETKLDYNKYR